MELETPTYSSGIFNYHKEDNTLVTEASDMAANAMHRHYGPAYDDAIDVGFSVLSEKTGNIARFVKCEEKYDDEGDLMWETFEMTPQSKRNFPDAATVRVIVFND